MVLEGRVPFLAVREAATNQLVHQKAKPAHELQCSHTFYMLPSTLYLVLMSTTHAYIN